MDISNAMVMGLGLGTVFVGLVCLIVLCYIMSAVCGLFKKNDMAMKPENNTDLPIANKQEVVAACCAVIAEEIGTDANNIKVLSFKRI